MTSKCLEPAVTIEDMTDEEISYLKCRGYDKFQRLVRTEPGGAIYPPEYRELSKAYCNFQFRSDDIVLMFYPRSGSTWTREILWAMTNLDRLHLADSQHINTRVFPIHYDMFLHYNEIDVSQFGGKTVMDLAAEQKSRRIIPSALHFWHLHPNLLDTCKVVYVARNPKDVCLSAFKIYTKMGRFTGDFSTWVELFTGDGVIYGSYRKHLKQAWLRRGHHNLHFMLFEDMKDNFMTELRKLNCFLELGLSDEQLLRVMDHTKYETMKNRDKKPLFKIEGDGSFFNGGRVGDWGKIASPELDAHMNTWIDKNILEMSDVFKYSGHLH